MERVEKRTRDGNRVRACKVCVYFRRPQSQVAVRNIPASGNLLSSLGQAKLPLVLRPYNAWPHRGQQSVESHFGFLSLCLLIFYHLAPSYISSQSADVILSDVRPFKLKIEALHAINVLLDEFLYNILNAAASLSTDRLRASLLGLLPTSLGKEALLEAEVELRAYWDRTNAEGGPAPPPEDDSRVFHLQWSFEVR